MPQSYYRVWIHAVWATKYRTPLINSGVEGKIYRFINNQLKDLRCPVYIVNGMPDHIHCLFLLNPNLPITKVLKQIKGTSSRYINENNLIPEKFAWQIGYGVFSVSDREIENVFEYIRNQKRHHRKYIFGEEINQLIESNNSNIVNIDIT